jgi:hypothetical protein
VAQDLDLVAAAIAAGLADSHNLVARNTLEILVTYLPIHSVCIMPYSIHIHSAPQHSVHCESGSAIYSIRLAQGHLKKDQLACVMTPALRVVLKRDMSLNRRLYTWLIGSEAGGMQSLQGVCGGLVPGMNDGFGCRRG